MLELSAWRAAADGRLPDVQRLLTEGASPDAKDWSRCPALVRAAANGHLDVVRALVRAGAKLEAANSGGGTALSLAATTGKHDCVEFLLGAGADVHAASSIGYTALHSAAERGQLECARLLVGAGADAAKRNGLLGGRKTPLELAQTGGHAEVVALLDRLAASPDPVAKARTELAALARSANGWSPPCAACWRSSSPTTMPPWTWLWSLRRCWRCAPRLAKSLRGRSSRM